MLEESPSIEPTIFGKGLEVEIADIKRAAKEKRTRKSQRQIREEEVKAFLLSLELGGYETVFFENGYKNMVDVFHMTEEDMAGLGMRKGHIKRLKKGIVAAPPLPSAEADAGVEEAPDLLTGDAGGIELTKYEDAPVASPPDPAHPDPRRRRRSRRPLQPAEPVLDDAEPAMLRV